MEFEINDDLIENHPLNIFTKLYSEDKNNKVYKECLENEIEDAIKALSENLDDSVVQLLKNEFENYVLNEEELEFIEDSNLKNELKTRTYVANRIISGVYKKRFKNQ